MREITAALEHGSSPRASEEILTERREQLI